MNKEKSIISKKFIKLFVGVIIALFTYSPITAFGIEFSGLQCVNDPNGAKTPCSPIFTSLVNEMLLQYADVEMGELPIDEHLLSDLLSNMSLGSGLSQKGLSTDYSSRIRVLMVGVGAGVGASAGDTGFQNINMAEFQDLYNAAQNGESFSIPGYGAGLGANVMVGIPLKLFRLPKLIFIDPNRMKAFGALMYYPRTITSGTTTVEMKYLNYSAHGQYKLIKKRDLAFGVLRWGGLDITSGVEYNSMSALVSSSDVIEPSNLKTIKDTQDNTQTMEVLELGGMGYMSNVKVTGSADFGVELTSMSVPVELSTSFRILYILSIFGGGAVDFNIGKSQVIMEPNLKISGDLLAGDPFRPDSTSRISSNVLLDLTSEGTAELITFRVFTGAQLNLGVAKLVATLSATPSPQAIGFTVAVRTGI